MGRHVLALALVFGTAAALGGCASSGGSARAADAAALPPSAPDTSHEAFVDLARTRPAEQAVAATPARGRTRHAGSEAAESSH